MDSLAPIQDTFVVHGSATPKGDATYLEIANNPDINEISYIKFDLSEYTNIHNAKLKIYLQQIGIRDSPIQVSRVIETWDNDTVWDTKPNTSPDNQTSIVSECTNCWIEIDVTHIVKDILSNTDDFGLSLSFLYDADSTDQIIVSSMEGSYPPILEITKTAAPPTISNISWSPAGDFHKLPSGASLTGSTEDLYLIGTDPGAFADPGFSDGEALLRIGTDGAMFAVAEGDHFRFDGMEWWILNIVCGPECSFITLADENAEAAREPKLGDEIQFSCNVDWHGETPDEVRWYYARTPNRCFDENDVSWTPFANEQFPLHIFEEDDDTDIVFIKAWARNKAGEIGELGDTCEPVFNLWAPRVGFQEGWLIAAFMAFILPGLAEKTEYYGDLVFDGTPTTPSGGFSLLWSPAEFVHWIAEAAAGVAEDMLDIIFGTAAAEETSGYSILWTAAEFVVWLYKSIAAAVESILDLVFK